MIKNTTYYTVIRADGEVFSYSHDGDFTSMKALREALDAVKRIPSCERVVFSDTRDINAPYRFEVISRSGLCGIIEYREGCEPKRLNPTELHKHFRRHQAW